jgi:hypothetical protein
MPLLNYTTRVSETKTISEIEKTLAVHGAKAILKEYDSDGNISAVAFQVASPCGEVSVKLPADVEATFRVLEKQQQTEKVPRHLVTMSHARAVSWRILKDWIEAQMAILETEMVTLDQIFLAYVLTPSGNTLYETVVQQKLLKAS